MRKAALILGWIALFQLPLGAQSQVQVMTQPGIRYEALKPHGGYLGIRLRDVTAEDVQQFRLPAEAGAVVQEVVEGSPAAEAGLEPQDVIVAVSGLPILTASQLQRTIRENPAGRTVELSIIRSGRSLKIPVKLGETEGPNFSALVPEFKGLERLPRDRAFQWREGEPDLFFFESQQRPRLGVQATPLTSQMADFLGAGVSEGLLILQVEKGTPAEASSLRAGDVIVKVDGKTVSSIGSLRRALDPGSHQLEIVRNGQRRSVEVQLGDSEKRGERTRI